MSCAQAAPPASPSAPPATAAALQEDRPALIPAPVAPSPAPPPQLSAPLPARSAWERLGEGGAADRSLRTLDPLAPRSQDRPTPACPAPPRRCSPGRPG